MTVESDVSQLAPLSLVEMFVWDDTVIGGTTVFRWHSGLQAGSDLQIGEVTVSGDFTPGAYTPSNVAISRASTATYYGSDGLLKTAAADTLRIDYDPVTHNALGLLVEAAATNTLKQSSNFANSAFIQNIGGFVTSVASTDIPGPDGLTPNVTKITFAMEVGLWSRQSSLSLPAGARTLSQWVYVPSGQGITNYRFSYDYADVDVAGGTTLTIFDRWVRVSSTATLAATRGFVDFNLSITGGPLIGKYFYVCNAQEEAGSVATSYIATGAAAATRAADTVTLSGSIGRNDWTVTQDNDVTVAFNDRTGPISFTRGNLSRSLVKSYEAVLDTSMSGLNMPIVWQGVTYEPYPIESGGFEVTTAGKLPRPTIRAANIGGQLGAYLRTMTDGLGAKLTRKRTLGKYLDAVNFAGGNPYANPNTAFPDDIYYVARKASENPIFVELELAVRFDVEGVMLPRRQVIAGTCQWVYRSAECSYAGGAILNDPVFSGVDKCGKTLDACKLRFGQHGVLRTSAFPASMLVRQ